MTVRRGDVFLSVRSDRDRKVIVDSIDTRRFKEPHAYIKPYECKGRGVWILVSSLLDQKKWVFYERKNA